MKTILLVEDNPHIMKINSNAFVMNGFDVLEANNASECEKILETNNVDLIVMDIMLPDGNGISLCKKIKHRSDIPILFLSALGESEDIVSGLKAGGDDYLAKPYDLEVLIARAEARLRNINKSSRFITYDNLKLDTVSMYGYINGKDMLLTQKEFQLLLLLSKNSEKIVDKKSIYKEIWGSDISNNQNALYTTISRVKKKLMTEKSGITVYIYRSEGYMLGKI